MKTTLQVKLLPSAEQHTALLDTMHAFNAACTWIAAYAYAHQCASKFQLQRALYYEVRQQFGLSAQLAVRAIAKSVDAYKRDTTQAVAFRPEGAVVYDDRILAFHGLEEVSLMTLTGRAVIPLQMGAYQRTRFSRAVGQADLVLISGTFFLLVTLDTPEEPPMEPTRFLGVDLGIVNLATDSDGNSYTGTPVEVVRQRCGTARKTYQATGTQSAKRRLRTLRHHEARFRRDTNHCIAKQLVAHAKDTQAALVLEDLTGIRDRMTVRKGQRNRSYGWGFAQLRAFVAYKATIAGVPVVVVDPRNTSRTCHRCGFVDKRNRRSQAEFSCLRCGHTAHADLNAARNLATRGLVSAPDLVAPRGGATCLSVVDTSPALQGGVTDTARRTLMCLRIRHGRQRPRPDGRGLQKRGFR
jgi:putative transposase